MTYPGQCPSGSASDNKAADGLPENVPHSGKYAVEPQYRSVCARRGLNRASHLCQQTPVIPHSLSTSKKHRIY